MLIAGETVSCTRQKAGTVGGGPPRPPAGAAGFATNGPAGTSVAAVIVVSGSFNDERLSHV
jgi:hypothetical protein